MPAKMTIKRSETEPTAEDSPDKSQGNPTKLRALLGRKFKKTNSDDTTRDEEEDDVGGGGRATGSEPEVDGAADSPTKKRGQQIWSNLKNRTAQFRQRSMERLRRSRIESTDGSTVGGDSTVNPPLTPPPATNGNGAHVSPTTPPMTTPDSGGEDFDALFEAAERRNRPGSEENDGEGVANGVDKAGREDRPSSTIYPSGLDSDAPPSPPVSLVTNKSPLDFDRASTITGYSEVGGDSSKKKTALYTLNVILREGKDLVVRDSNGASDPYCKFVIDGKTLYKSRIVFKNLNPRWEESFTLPIDDLGKQVNVKVYDYDRGRKDDYMGAASFDISTLELNTAKELQLNLEDPKAPEPYMGYIALTCTLVPKAPQESGVKRNASRQESTKKKPVVIGIVTIVLVEGKNLLAMDDNGYSDPYVKGRLGNERFKSKYKEKTLSPRWLEQFDMPVYEDQTTLLEISVWDHDMSGKDDIMGRGVLEVSTMEKEKTHTVKMALEDGAGEVTFLLTITATTSADAKTDMSTFRLDATEKQAIARKYAITSTPKAMKDIGWLQIKVIKAEGIASADLGGKSDPFCVVELVNTRAQTPTIYKTLQPEWGKVYQFNIKDIHEILEVTVFDEDRDRKIEFLGKVLIPLLRIHNGEKRWYQLKDRKASVRVKGAILLEMEFVYNPVRAAIRTINPREEKYIKPERKFKIAEMRKNIDRLKQMGEAAAEGGKFIAYCLSWQSKPKSALACLVYCLIVWNFQLYFLPLGLLALFLKNLLVIHIGGNLMKEKSEDEYVADEEEDEDDDKDAKKHTKASAGKEEKKGLREKWQAMQDMMYEMQEKLEMAATMGERLKNAANFTVPWLSWLAIIAFTIGTVVLFFVPLRILLLAWGINKFSKKLKDPNFVDNNELLDYLSRVPSDKELIMYRELRPDPGIGASKKKRA